MRMKNRFGKTVSILAACIVTASAVCGCGAEKNNSLVKDKYDGWEDSDKDFSSLKTPGSQENAYEYKTFFLPEVDGIKQPYVGDTMPYYEDGTFYIYYLKDGGDSYNHSVYLATTKDFVTYEEVQEPVLEANRDGGQDGWIGTGSVVKVDGTYYFFYTGHASSNCEYQEKVMVAKSSDLTHFEKVEGWDITPDASLGQKQDFRDPQAYYDAATGEIVMTITASQSGRARILKYTLSKDLSAYKYDGIIFTDPIGQVYNLECSDTFKIGDKYYITYSAQDDTLWYAMSDNAYGPYSEPQRLEGKLFYAAKHVEKDNSYYMVGWTRRSESPSSTAEVQGWAGNLVTQQIKQLSDGSLVLCPVDEIKSAFSKERKLMINGDQFDIDAGSLYNYQETFMAFESFMLEGTFNYEKDGTFGLAFTYGKDNKDDKMIMVDPRNQTVSLAFNGGSNVITEFPIAIENGKDYHFTYIQEGSVGIFYIDDQAALSVRLYGVSGQTVRAFASGNKVSFSSLKEYTK